MDAPGEMAPPDFDGLYRALGRLVVASADMESRLRYVVSWISGDDDAGWIVFEWVRRAAPELTTGRRVVGDTKSAAGRRFIVLPGFLRKDLERHLKWFAGMETDGLLFVGEKGAPFRRSSFGRKWRRARSTVGLPETFRFYDLRHTGHTLATQTGATLKDTMVRAGQSSERAALIY